MTARSTFAAVDCKLEVHGIHPGAERDEILHPLGFCPGMHFVARPAGPASFLVDVNEVQVLIAVAKVSQGRREFIQNERIFMTLEAQIIHFDGERAIEFVWKFVRQDSEMLRAVGLMA